MQYDSSWLKPLKVGMKIKPCKPSDAYAGRTMTITKIIPDPEGRLMGGFVKLKLSEKVNGKRYSQPRIWWVYEECVLLEA